jgi:hypothetical protein
MIIFDYVDLDKIGKKAEANGLTEEQLNMVLNEE